MSSAVEAADADYIVGRGPRDLGDASPRYRAAYHKRYSELLAIARDMQHCPPCSKEWHAWLDWTLPPEPIVLCSPGRPSVREMRAHQEVRTRTGEAHRARP